MKQDGNFEDIIEVLENLETVQLLAKNNNRLNAVVVNFNKVQDNICYSAYAKLRENFCGHFERIVQECMTAKELVSAAAKIDEIYGEGTTSNLPLLEQISFITRHVAIYVASNIVDDHLTPAKDKKVLKEHFYNKLKVTDDGEHVTLVAEDEDYVQLFKSYYAEEED